jgi:ribosomal protein S18 acetylase RimI-like enzyme
MTGALPVVVREAVPAEYDAIGEATAAAYSVFPGAADYPDYMAELRDVARRAQDCPILVALDAATGQVLGGAAYVPGPGNRYAELERDGEAGIRMLAVSPEAQGRGAGRALLEALMARARAAGRTGIALYTLDTMTVAHRLYASAGFRRDPSRDWDVEPGLILRCFSIAFADGDGPNAPPAPGGG